MDKAEYNLKLEESYRCVDQGNYAEAARIADTIDWKRVRNVRTLCMISEIYEAEDRYAESKELLLAWKKFWTLTVSPDCETQLSPLTSLCALFRCITVVCACSLM